MDFFKLCIYICSIVSQSIKEQQFLADPDRCVDYKMEIIKDTQDRNKPLFCVTPADGEQVWF